MDGNFLGGKTYSTINNGFSSNLNAACWRTCSLLNFVRGHGFVVTNNFFKNMTIFALKCIFASGHFLWLCSSVWLRINLKSRRLTMFLFDWLSCTVAIFLMELVQQIFISCLSTIIHMYAYWWYCAINIWFMFVTSQLKNNVVIFQSLQLDPLIWTLIHHIWLTLWVYGHFILYILTPQIFFHLNHKWLFSKFWLLY